MRFTEQELRDFLTRAYQQELKTAQEANTYGTRDEVAYAQGSSDAYKFVLRFLDEYKLEEVHND